MPSTLPLMTIRRSEEQRSDQGVSIQVIITNIGELSREFDSYELRTQMCLTPNVYVSEPQATNGELSFSVDMAAAQFRRLRAGWIIRHVLKMMPGVIVQVLDLASGDPYYVVAIRIDGRLWTFRRPSVIELIEFTKYINDLMLRVEVDANFARLVSDSLPETPHPTQGAALTELRLLLALLNLNRDE